MNVGNLLALVVACIGVLLGAAVATFWGAITGWLAQMAVGDWIVLGLAAFGFNIPIGSIWSVGALLGFVSYYFNQRK